MNGVPPLPWVFHSYLGLQNAMCTSFSGLVVRTTHMTGIVTDIGNILGQACRKDTHAELWRLKVHVPLLFGFLFGGFIGELGWLWLGEGSLLIPCFFTGGVAVLYLSLPWVKEAAKRAEELTYLISSQKEQEGAVNPHLMDYQKQLQSDMRTFMADIEHDTAQVIELSSISKQIN